MILLWQQIGLLQGIISIGYPNNSLHCYCFCTSCGHLDHNQATRVSPNSAILLAFFENDPRTQKFWLLSRGPALKKESALFEALCSAVDYYSLFEKEVSPFAAPNVAHYGLTFDTIISVDPWLLLIFYFLGPSLFCTSYTSIINCGNSPLIRWLILKKYTRFNSIIAGIVSRKLSKCDCFGHCTVVHAYWTPWNRSRAIQAFSVRAKQKARGRSRSRSFLRLKLV